MSSVSQEEPQPGFLGARLYLNAALKGSSGQEKVPAPVTWGQRGRGDTHGARLAVEADEKQGLGHQDGEGQVGVDVVALVVDGADRAAGREAGLSSGRRAGSGRPPHVLLPEAFTQRPRCRRNSGAPSCARKPPSSDPAPCSRPAPPGLSPARRSDPALSPVLLTTPF